MTAYRVVDDHKELDNIGSHSHDEIDVHIDLTAFVVASGTTGPIPPSARILMPGSGISIVDSGPGGSLTISSIGSGSSSPGGDPGQVQFNDGGSFGGSTGLTYDKLTNTLTGTIISATSGFSGSLTRLNDGSSYLTAGTTSNTAQTGSIAITSGSTGQVTVSAYVFPNDLTVSLTGGRTFGRYASGTTIPATGKTPAEVILLAIAEPINPTVSLTSPTSILFNQTAISNVLNFSYTINSLGASVSSVLLEWRRNNSGVWTTLTTNPAATTYTHSLTDSNYNTQPFNYRYTVTDTLGATLTVTLNITPQAYAQPSISLSTITTTPGTVVGETNLKREKGNVGSTLSGTITRNRINVPITSYSVQYSTNNATWTDVPGLSSVPVTGNPASVTIPSTSHYDASLKSFSAIYYRVSVVDTYQTSTGGNTTVNFLNTIFYGPSATGPVDSIGVRSLGSQVFTDTANPFNLITGTTYSVFTVAMPTTNSLTEVLDLDALNANITIRYILSTFNVNDGGGIATSYKVYTMTNAIPYAPSHRHQVTRA
jgi:hypothetical protein